MKTIKSILVAATLVCASVVSTMSAQQAQSAQKHEFQLAVGDSVMIKRECQRYCTGEEPSSWVWDKILTVRQLGTKKFADGVLLMNIYSWMCEDCLISVNGHAAEAAAKAAEEQKEERRAFEEKRGIKSEPAKPAAQKAEPAKPAAQKAEPAKPAAQKAEPAPTVVAVGQAAKAEAQPAAQNADVEEAVRRAEAAAERAEAAALRAEAAAKRAEAAAAKKAGSGTVASAEAAEASMDMAPFETAKFAEEVPVGQKYQYDRFTIGLRGGAASLMHHSDKANWTCGGDVVLDLQYAHYWAKGGRPVDLGIIVGLGLGYAQSGLKVNYDSTAFTDANVDYTVVAKDIKETDHELQLEVPLMFSLIHNKGLFFNIGPKFMMPVYSPYKQSLDQNGTHISAYFPEYGITIKDNPVTGQYTGQQPVASNGIQFNINVMLTAEIGYEWRLKSGNSLGLGAYANYCVFNTFKNATSTKGLFDLTAPTDDAKAVLDVLSATKTYADKLGYFDAGIKIAYHFNFLKKQASGPEPLDQ